MRDLYNHSPSTATLKPLIKPFELPLKQAAEGFHDRQK